jgi:hypothetical protein
MTENPTKDPADGSPETRATANATGPVQRQRRRALAVFFGIIGVYFLVAYLLVPRLWLRYAHRHPGLEDIPRVTHTADDIPADPLNVALIGSEADLKTIMVAARWYPANPLTLRSCLEIASATVLKRPYDEAPVSSLYLFDRKEDLAFEKPVGDNPRHRHHVRFWKSDEPGDDGQVVWVGAAVYDKSVGLSHTTGQITHHTDPNVDAERDQLFHDLEKTGDLGPVIVVNDFHTVREGRNGEGDRWYTDGNLWQGTIAISSSHAELHVNTDNSAVPAANSDEPPTEKTHEK